MDNINIIPIIVNLLLSDPVSPPVSPPVEIVSQRPEQVLSCRAVFHEDESTVPRIFDPAPLTYQAQGCDVLIAVGCGQCEFLED